MSKSKMKPRAQPAMKSAYLVASFDVTTSSPQLRGVGVYSSSWRSLTLRHNREVFYADLLEAMGEDYEEAEKNLMHAIVHTPGLHWVPTWLARRAGRMPL